MFRESRALASAPRGAEAAAGSSAPKTLDPATKSSTPASAPRRSCRGRCRRRSRAPPRRQQRTQAARPARRARDVALPAPARIDAHQEAEVDDLGDRLDRLDGRAGVDHDAGGAAELADQLQRVVDVRRRLGVDRDHVRARLGEDSICRSGRSIMRWQSRMPPRACTSSLSDATISGPIVIGGTKWPSIDVDVDHLAPASITVVTCSASREKSQARSEGAISPRDRAQSPPRRRVRPSSRRRTRGTARPTDVAAPSPSGARTTPAAAARRARDLAGRAGRAARARPRRATAARCRARAHGLLDRAVGAEGQRLRAEPVVAEELGDELARPRAGLAHQPHELAELLGPAARGRADRRGTPSSRTRSR